MPPKQKYSNPKLRDEVKEEIQEGDKGGAPGQWSARKAQMMAKEYKNRGGDYNTPKSSKDESAKHLDKWTEEDWQTKEGSGDAKQADGTQKRYLPKKAWDKMSEKEKKETDQKKQEGSKQGNQYVSNTGTAKAARKDAQADNDNEQDEATKADNENENEKKKPARTRSRTRSKAQPKQGKSETTEESKDEETTNEIANDEVDAAGSDRSKPSDNEANVTPSSGRKRTRKRSRKQAGNDENTSQDQKKQKTTPSESETVGSKHDNATPPAKQGSNSRLPRKGQKNVHWKAMPGWVEGEVVEILKGDKEVDGKNIKATKTDPRIVLKSKSSGKICVHKPDNVYFD